MTSPYVRFWYAITLAFVACLVCALTAVGYSLYVQRRGDQRWCSLLVQLTDAQRATPPASPSGRSFAAELERLRREFHCAR